MGDIVVKQKLQLKLNTKHKLILLNNRKMNRKIKPIVFVATVIITISTLYATVGKHHGMHCGNYNEQAKCSNHSIKDITNDTSIKR